MKEYFGNYLGMVINNSDPEYRGRVQVFIPHIMPALYEDWNKEGTDIQISCVGSNIPEGLSPEIHDRLIKILPWAEAASPIIGGSAPGNLLSNVLGGAAAGAATGGVAGALVGAAAGAANYVYNQEPTTKPAVIPGELGALYNEAKNYVGLDKNGNPKDALATKALAGYNGGGYMGACGRGTVAALGAMSGNAALQQGTAGGNANDYSIGKSAPNDVFAKSGLYNPKVPAPSNYAEDSSQWRIGDVIACDGGTGFGHIQTYVGVGSKPWTSDTPQQKPGMGAQYRNCALIRATPEAQAKMKAKLDSLYGQGATPPPGGPAEGTAESGALALESPLTNPPGKTSTTAPTPPPAATPQQGAITPTQGAGMTGTVSGGGTASQQPLNPSQNNVNPQQLYNTIYKQMETKMAGNPVPSDITKYGVSADLHGLTTLMMKVSYKESNFENSAGGDKGFFSGYSATTGQKTIPGGSHGLFQLSPIDAATYKRLGFEGKGDIVAWKDKNGELTNTGTRAFTIEQLKDPNFNVDVTTSIWADSILRNGTVGNQTTKDYGWIKDSEVPKLAKYNGEGLSYTGDGLPISSAANASAASSSASAPSVVNNTDPGGLTTVFNTNDMAKGLFSYPNPGAMVWVFFREGNPLYPVYFAASYSSKEWSSVYRTSSPSPLASHATLGGPQINSDVLSLGGGSALVNTVNPFDNKVTFGLHAPDGSNIIFTNGQRQDYTRHNKRDQVDRDRFETTMGFKEQWVEGDYNINVRGNYFIKVGKIDQETMDALRKMADYSSQINAQLTQSSGGGGGGSGASKEQTKPPAADPSVLEDKPITLPDAFQKGIDKQTSTYWETKTPIIQTGIIPAEPTKPRFNGNSTTTAGPTNANVIASYTDPSSPYYKK